MEHTGFPSDETLAAFLDGRLDPDTRRHVVEHMTTCDECYATVVGGGGIDLMARREAAPVVEHRARRGWRGLAVAAALIVLVGIPVAIYRRNPPVPSFSVQRAELMAAAPQIRHEEGRLFEFSYRERPVHRGGTADEKEKNEDPHHYRLLVAAATIEKRVGPHSDPDTLHANGIARVLLNEPANAAESLERALLLSTNEHSPTAAIQRCNSVELLVDASVAYQARGAKTRDKNDYVLALDAAERAERLAPHRPEVLWNKAVAIQSLGMQLEAQKAWEAYLAADPSSPWSDDARERLRNLQGSLELSRDGLQLNGAIEAEEASYVRALVRRFSFEARTAAEETLLATLDGTSIDRRSRIAAVQLIGQELQRRGEHLISDAVWRLESVQGEDAVALVDAHQSYAAGRRELADGRLENAQERFANAAAKFERAESPFAMLARIGLVSCTFMRNDYLKAGRELESSLVLTKEVAGRYPSVQARVLWLKAVIDDQLGEKLASYQAFSDAARIFRTLEEGPNAAQMEGLLASQLDQAGENCQAIRHYVDALAELGSAPGTKRFQVHFEAVFAALESGHLGWAAAILDDVQRHVSLSSNDRAMTGMLTSLLESKRGAGMDALRTLERASLDAALIVDANVRERVEANLNLSRIAISRNAGVSPPAPLIEAAMQFFERSGSHLASSELLTERGHLRATQNDRDGAQRDFELAIAEIERMEPSVGALPFGTALMVQTRSPFEELMGILLAKGDLENALSCAERESALAISPLYFRDHHAETLFYASVQRNLRRWRGIAGRGVYIIRYYAMKDRTVQFVIDGTSIRASSVPVGRAEITDMVRRFEAVAQTGDVETVRAESRRLSTVLVGPWIMTVPAGANIVFAATGGLAGVPFSALIEPNSGAYLIERHPISVVPSLSLYAEAVEEDVRRNSTGVAFLSAGEVAPSLGLETLRGAVAEVRSGADTYTRAVKVENATRASFLSSTRNAAVVHFAGHAVVDEEAPLSSALVFSDADPETAQLRLSEFRHAELAGIRLLILSACSTRRSAREGMSISDVLLMQGVPSVIAASWDVDDGNTRILMRELHAALRLRSGRAAALRIAQLHCLHSADRSLSRPATWAAFSLVGASAAIDV